MEWILISDVKVGDKISLNAEKIHQRNLKQRHLVAGDSEKEP